MAVAGILTGRRPAALMLASLAALATLCPGQAQKRKYPPPPAITILEITVQRTRGLITVDGRLRSLAARPLQGLHLLLEFLASDNMVITRQRGAVEPDPLEPGEETEFRWQMRDHARAVSVRIQATEASGQEIIVKNSGPFYIE